MKLHGWGRHPVIEAVGETFDLEDRARVLITRPVEWIAHGLGKSYGDSALAEHVLLTRRWNKMLDLDPVAGTITCQSGVTLAELIDLLIPQGWFLHVTPGTKLITVGGAIASDVHGKNHHVAGCFSTSVISLRLMLADGRVVTCSPTLRGDLFRATCGGMGLTGLILDATLKLQPVNSAFIRETMIPCANLEESFAQFEQNQGAPYSMAWIDCLAKGDRRGRSILMAGRHADDGELRLPPSGRLAVPMDCPTFMLNAYSVSLFNQIYYYFHNRRVQDRRVPIDPFFYPLDKIAHWNRMYGVKGFTQYQFVLPKAASFKGLKVILEKIARSGLGSFLAVLKLCGPQNDNLLSFPLEGYSLALDFKIQAALFPLLDQLDQVVLDHGGRIYLTKDVRMSAETLRRSYAHTEAFAALRAKSGLDAKFNSLQSRRLEI
jgi:decaprenylphospho-beta-D-ribofuranose 2-oxidase